jgi:hypothetical protein
MLAMNPLYQRNFNVNYFEKEEHVWGIQANLKDKHHDLAVEVDVAVPEMVILDCRIKFSRYPVVQCVMIEDLAQQLKGTCIFSDYQPKCLKLFLGPQGCPNIMTLFSVSVPALIYFYFPHQIKIGKMTHQEWEAMVKTRFASACLAHSLMYNPVS